MPIVQLLPDAPASQINNTPEIQPESYCSTVVDTQNAPLNTLLAYVDGMPWTVNYYRQVITTQSDLKEQDVGETGVYQQYEKINNMEIRVTESLSGDQNQDTAQMKISGAALIYPFLTPNVGDMFIADAGFNQKGVYTIDAVERKSFNLDTTYQISYHLMDFTNRAPGRVADLDTKVIREYYFDKSRLMMGMPPTLTTQDYANMQSLTRYFQQIVNDYFNVFYIHDYDTLAIPGQGTGCYDPFVVDYVLKIVNTFDNLVIRKVRNYATDNDDYLRQPQFWKMMLTRDIGMLPYINRFMGLVDVKYFNYNSMFKGIRYSRMSYVLYPTTADFSMMNPNDLVPVSDPLLMNYDTPGTTVFSQAPIFKPQAFRQLVDSKSSGGSLVDLLANSTTANNTIGQVIYPSLNLDHSYVLSGAFYSQSGKLSLLETLVTNYLEGNALSLDDIVSCCKIYRNWNRMDQFYYLPILMTLIKTAQQEACST